MLRLQGLCTFIASCAHWFMNKPHPIIQIMYLVVVLGAFGLFVQAGFPLLQHNPYFAPHHKAEAYVLLAGCLLTFALASFVDPGVVRKESCAGYCQLYEADGVLYSPSKPECSTCKQARPARSKHCSVCDRCVAKFDHHW
jgi:palmitoyltransferase